MGFLTLKFDKTDISVTNQTLDKGQARRLCLWSDGKARQNTYVLDVMTEIEIDGLNMANRKTKAIEAVDSLHTMS